MTDVLKRFLDQARSPISREAQIFFAAIDEGAEVLRAELVVDVVEASTHDATFHLRYSVGERPIEVSFEWNEAVERELQRRRVRMSTLRAEALRGGILLVFALRSCDTQFGARFTNRVLRKVLFDQFSGFETIREIIGYLSDGMVAEQPEYRDCRNVIEAIIVEYQAHLKTLGYSSEDQTAVVVASLYFLVDMRTQVTLRKLIRSEP